MQWKESIVEIKKLFQENHVVYSYEIFPPKVDSPLERVYDTIGELAGMQPDYISVTYGAGGSAQNNRTTRLTGRIRKRYGVESLAHLTCIGATKQHIDRTLDELQAHSVRNVLALRGDIPGSGFDPQDFSNSQELIRYVKGRGFGVAAAAYPEGHAETKVKDKDIEILKWKEEAGADYFITQLFFDNERFYEFMDKVMKKGIGAPVQAGVMPITKARQIKRVVELSGASLPKSFLRMIDRYGHDEAALRDAGIAYATEQISSLIAAGARGIHLYTMNDASVAGAVTRNIDSLIRAVNGKEAM